RPSGEGDELEGKRTGAEEADRSGRSPPRGVHASRGATRSAGHRTRRGDRVTYYAVFLDLADERCVVLGEGKLAAEKAAGLREAGAAVRVIASKDYRRGDLAGARLVFDASDDPAVNRESWAEAEAAGILINVVDRPAQCRFIAPAIVRRDPLLIAISTEGQSPFLASSLRARLERWLGREWGPFTALIGRTRRELRERGIPIQQQTKIYKRLLASDIRKMLRND